MLHSVHSKHTGTQHRALLTVSCLWLTALKFNTEMWHLLQHTHIRIESVIVIKCSPERVLMENIFEIAVIFCNTSETCISLLSALKYKDGVCNIFNCSCTQKRCLARSLSALCHGQRVWLSDKPASLRRGILYFFSSVSPVFFPLPFQSVSISVKSAVTFYLFHSQIPTSHQLF